MNLILDVITVLIFAAVIYASYRKGLVRSVIELAGYIASFAIASFFSYPAGNWIYNTILKPIVYGKMSSYISAQTGKQAAVSASASLSSVDWQSFLSQIPVEFKKLLGDFNIDISTLQHLSGAKVGGDMLSKGIVDALVAPIATYIGRGIAFALVFALCMCIVRIIAGLTDGIFKLPVLGTANSIGGAAVGIVKACIIMFIVSTLIAISVPMLSLQKDSPITNKTINDTFIYKHIQEINPITGILLKK